ncbi:MAG: hypothetical protein MI976_08360 [Pseudomonadales bacterium]|nr:hypothetical protein [Pseudomonadales bacterium]
MNDEANSMTAGFLGDMSARDFVSLSLNETERRLQTLGLSKDTLLDPEDEFDCQVAVLRYNYLLAERSAFTFKNSDPNFWRMLRARLQPMILAYLTHEKFVQNLEGDSLDRKVKEMMEVYRQRLATTEEFKNLFFAIEGKSDRHMSTTAVPAPNAITENPVEQAPSLTAVAEKKHADGSGGIADVQANVIRQLQESIKEQERVEKRLQKQLKEKDEELFRHEKTIEKHEKQHHELLAEIDRLSTENLQLKISLDASTKEKLDNTTANNAAASPADIDVAQAENQDSADDHELILKIESLERELKNTSSAAYNAFMANSDLGIVILFILSAFRSASLPRLGEEVIRSLKTYGLTAVVRFRSELGVDFYSDGKVSDGDKLLIKNNESSGRVVDLDKGYLLYDEHSVLLVKNIPTNDEERLGRLKDNLNTVMKATEAAAKLIVLNHSSEMQQKRMEQLLMRSNDVFVKLDKNLEKNANTAIAMLKKVSMDLRTQLKISPGGPGSAQLNAASKQAEAGIRPLFNIEKLVDTAFMKNVARVVTALHKDNT